MEPEQDGGVAEPAYPPHSPWSTPPVRRAPRPEEATPPAPHAASTALTPQAPHPAASTAPTSHASRPVGSTPPAASIPLTAAQRPPAAVPQPPPSPPAPVHRPQPTSRPAWTRREVGPPSVAGAVPRSRPASDAESFRPPDEDETTERLSDPGLSPGPVVGAPDPYRPGANGHQPTAHSNLDIEIPLHYPIPTADELTARRVTRPREWVATTGVRGAARRGTFGLVRLRPNRRERQARADVASVRRSFGGLRQVTIVNPKGGAGKTVATLMLGLTFGQTRGGFVLAWDNNETQGTLGMRGQTDAPGRTVRDLLRDLHRFAGAGGRIGELAAYVRQQEGAAFDVLASDEGATAGEMLTATAFREIREVVGRFYKLLLVDTGNNVRADNWQAAIDATDQLVVTMSARNDSAETAARLLDHLEQIGRRELVRRAVAVLTMPPHRQDADPRAIERHFEQRCRVVLRVPYDRHLDSGAPVDYPAISPESRRAWLRVAAAIADGL